MITLRNHFIHEGFYIPKNSLAVKTDKADNPKPQNKKYTLDIRIKYERLIKRLAYMTIYSKFLNLKIKNKDIGNV